MSPYQYVTVTDKHSEQELHRWGPFNKKDLAVLMRPINHTVNWLTQRIDMIALSEEDAEAFAQKARIFAIEAHGGQQYGDKPYAFHLDDVAGILHDFGYGPLMRALGYTHDVGEDTGKTPQEIEASLSLYVAQGVAILSDEPGENRRERKIKTYTKMATVEGALLAALIAKLADRYGNIRHSLTNGNKKQLKMYAKEQPAFAAAVFREGVAEDLQEAITMALEEAEIVLA